MNEKTWKFNDREEDTTLKLPKTRKEKRKEKRSNKGKRKYGFK